MDGEGVADVTVVGGEDVSPAGGCDPSLDEDVHAMSSINAVITASDERPQDADTPRRYHQHPA